MKRLLDIVWDNAKVLLILFIVLVIIYLTGPHYGWLDYLGLESGERNGESGSKISILELIYYFFISIAVLFIVYLPFFLFGKGFKKIKGKMVERRYNKNKQQMWIKAQQSPADMFAYKARFGEFEEE